MNRLSDQAKRDLLSFLLTLLIYFLFIVLWRHYASVFPALSPQQTVSEISLDLSEFVKEPEMANTPVLEEEAAKEEAEVREKPEEPMAEKEPEAPEEIIPQKPLLAPDLAPKKKRSSHHCPNPPKRVTAKKKKSVKKARKPQHAVHTRRTSGSQKRGKHKTQSSSRGSSQFLARLKATINTNKVYPAAARKRGMQGRVKVHFRVTARGKIANLSAKGPRIFVNSAKSAVKKSFPISTRGASLPLNVTLTLNYRLKS